MPHEWVLGQHVLSKLRLADVQRDLHRCGRHLRQTENRAVSRQPECVRVLPLCSPRQVLPLQSSARGKPLALSSVSASMASSIETNSFASQASYSGSARRWCHTSAYFFSSTKLPGVRSTKCSKIGITVAFQSVGTGDRKGSHDAPGGFSSAPFSATSHMLPIAPNQRSRSSAGLPYIRARQFFDSLARAVSRVSTEGSGADWCGCAVKGTKVPS